MIQSATTPCFSSHQLLKFGDTVSGFLVGSVYRMIAHPVSFALSQSGWGDTWDSVSVAPAVVVRAV